MNLDFKVGHQRSRSFSEYEPRTMRHHTWAAIAFGVVGAGVSAYGANKQNKAQKEANSQNQANQAAENASAWASYLLSRGVNPNGVATGQIPTNPVAVNARLPLWANASFAQPNARKTWRRVGSTTPVGTLARSATASAAALPAPVASVAPAGSGPSQLVDILSGNPLGLGGKDRSFFDPLGIF
jgi:hypothetical protein